MTGHDNWIVSKKIPSFYWIHLEIMIGYFIVIQCCNAKLPIGVVVKVLTWYEKDISSLT